ncbi:hypothetical protein O9X98_15100 [Agrobacterium salinitolerans]|nr:hypothetical protein [Agrobacterium salinitolerans]
MPNVLTVAAVGVITVADLNASADMPWFKVLAWCVLWIIVLAIVFAGTDSRR